MPKKAHLGFSMVMTSNTESICQTYTQPYPAMPKKVWILNEAGKQLQFLFSIKQEVSV